MNVATTFRELREADAWTSRYRHLARALGGVKKYGEDTPVPVLTILEANGIEDAEWALVHCPSLVPLDAEYRAKCKPLDAEYQAKRKPLDDEYIAKCKQLDAEYRAKRKQLYDEYLTDLAALLRRIVEEATNA